MNKGKKIGKKRIGIDRLPKMPMGTKIHKDKKQEVDINAEVFRCRFCGKFFELDEMAFGKGKINYCINYCVECDMKASKNEKFQCHFCGHWYEKEDFYTVRDRIICEYCLDNTEFASK